MHFFILYIYILDDTVFWTLRYLHTFAAVQSGGRLPVSRDRWNISVIIGARSCAHSRRNLLGILSGPTAFDTLMFRRSFSVPSMLTTMSLIPFRTLRVVGGISVDFDRVNTELNCLSNISAFDPLSLNSLPPSFNPLTPKCAFCRLFMRAMFILP